MSLIILMFHNSADDQKVTVKKISWDDLFGPNGSTDIVSVVDNQEVRVTYANNILAISSASYVDTIFNCDRPLPISGLYIKTAGGLEITGLPMNLNFGLWATADDIQVDTVIQSRGFVRLDVGLISSKDIKTINGLVQINKKIETNRLIIQTRDLSINSHVFANISNIKFDSLAIEPRAKLCVGDKQAVFKYCITNTDFATVSSWNEITGSTSEQTSSEADLRSLIGKKLINKGTLKVYNSWLIIDGDVLHEASSKTVYEDVNVFVTRDMSVSEKTIIDGNNTYFIFAAIAFIFLKLKNACSYVKNLFAKTSRNENVPVNVVTNDIATDIKQNHASKEPGLLLWSPRKEMSDFDKIYTQSLHKVTYSGPHI